MHNNSQETYARWASDAEIKSSLYQVNLNGDSPEYGGIPLFADSDSVYVDQTDTHSLIIGSTGSKKSRLIGMPALRIYAEAGESFIATDPKAELYERTLPLLREKGYRVFVLNLRDPQQSNGWNPLTIPYHLYKNGQRDKAVELVIDLSNSCIKDDYVNDPYWQNSAANSLAGLILILFECGGPNQIHFKSLKALRTQAFRCIKGEEIPFIQDNFLKYLNPASSVRSLLNGTAEVTEQTRSCILSVFDQAMQPFFSQDNLIDMLSGSDLGMRSIGKEKTAVFLLIPDENTLYHRLVSVFVKQCYTELILEAQKQPTTKALPFRVNFLLDEFSSLPPISNFPEMITASRGRNIRFNLIIQSFNQLHRQYGNHAQTIKGNCENWVFLHSRELGLLQELVELSGKKNNDEPLVTVSMLQTLDKDKGEAFVLCKRLHPFIASLPDIDRYPGIFHEKKRVWYPKNTRKTQSVFDLEEFCIFEPDFSRLFTGKSGREHPSMSR